MFKGHIHYKYLQMAIFHSCVKVPEGKSADQGLQYPIDQGMSFVFVEPFDGQHKPNMGNYYTPIIILK